MTKTVIVSVVIIFFYVSPTAAQVFDDWEARPNISLKYKINKRWAIAATYYLYMDRNMSHYDKSVIAADLSFKVSSWMKAGIDYRHGIEKDGHYHDIRYAVTFDHNSPSKRWKIAYRPMVQQEFSSLRKEHLAEHPVKYYLRNRITVSFDVTSKTEIYLFTENYLKSTQGDLYFHRQKSALGAEYEINGRNKIGVRFEVINKKNGKTYARPNISYTYTLGSRKK
ncbi:MAG: DUF2490 domain-containing protein [Chitinophagaceae bacterium]|nr:DUF2490 domain-containing protein [Chitinophagaceae bacterium]